METNVSFKELLVYKMKKQIVVVVMVLVMLIWVVFVTPDSKDLIVKILVLIAEILYPIVVEKDDVIKKMVFANANMDSKEMNVKLYSKDVL